MRLDQLAQFSIIGLGVPAIWLVGRTEDWKKWGYLLGLLTEPGWFYTSYINEQWGIFILSLWYLYAWAQGVYNYIIKPAGIKS